MTAELLTLAEKPRANKPPIKAATTARSSHPSCRTLIGAHPSTGCPRNYARGIGAPIRFELAPSPGYRLRDWKCFVSQEDANQPSPVPRPPRKDKRRYIR